jgi:heme exporter protein D
MITSLGPYASFIISAYTLVIAVVVVMIGWIAFDYQRQQQQLRDLQAQGAKRRSEQRAGTAV